MNKSFESDTDWQRWLFGVAWQGSLGLSDPLGQHLGRLWICVGPFMLKVWFER